MKGAQNKENVKGGNQGKKFVMQYAPKPRKRGPMEYIQTIKNNYFDNTKKINPVTKGKKLFTQRQVMYK